MRLRTSLSLLAILSASCSWSQPDDTPDARSAETAGDVVNPPFGLTLDGIVKAVGDGKFSGSVLVAKGDEITLAKGYGLAHVASGRFNTSLTVFDAGSLAKTFTAIAILQLAEAGRLTLDDPLSKHFDDLPPEKGVITIDQILTHSAGFEQYHGGSDFSNLSREAALEEIFATPLKFEPGAHYEYSNSGHTVLAAIIEDISGQSWTEYLTARIFTPAGMEFTGFYGDERWKESGAAHGYENGSDRASPYSWSGPQWVLIGNGGLVTNVIDLFHWHRALQTGKLLSEPWLEELTQARLTSGGYLPNLYQGIREIPQDQITLSYFGWRWQDLDQVLILEKGGAMDYGHTALLRYEPELDVLIVILSNQWIEDANGNLLRVPLMDAIQAAVVREWRP
ncbi:MAG: beta-lactamase family protein [Planctomycetaceae bacterium]|nr:beta-lactamase family protein [Planctomycetaceae bacterium]MCA9112298.1 beta-lactamase family protein [Planctomycetaceae bacterium]